MISLRGWGKSARIVIEHSKYQMNRLSFPFAALAICFCLGACERHSFEDTKVLFESHGDHGHGDGHSDEKGGDHGKAHDGDGEKKESGEH